MKVIRTFDKATQKTHVTTISLISNQGPTVSEYDELPDIPAASASTVTSINNLGDKIDRFGGEMTAYMAAFNNSEKSLYSGENPPVNVITTTLNQKNTPISLDKLLGNYKIIRVIMQASTPLDEDLLVSIDDNTNNANIALFDYSMFDEGLTYNSPVSIIIPDNCEFVTICSNTDKTIFVSLLYMKR